MCVTVGFGKILRTVPTIVTAHTLCASRDTRFPMGGGYLYRVLNYAEKAELSKCFWYPKENWG